MVEFGLKLQYIKDFLASSDPVNDFRPSGRVHATP